MGGATLFSGAAGTGLYTNTVPSVSDCSISLFARPLGPGIDGYNEIFFLTYAAFGSDGFGNAHTLHLGDDGGTACHAGYVNEGHTVTLEAAASSIPYGQWVHLGLVISGATATLYWKPVGAPAHNVLSATSGVIPFTPAGIQIGDDWDGFTADSDAANAVICGVKFWSAVVLTAEDMARESETVDLVRTADVWAHWPLTSDKDVFDRSGRSNTLTVHGTLSQVAGPPISEVKARRWSRFAPSAVTAIFEEDFPWGSLVTSPATPILVAAYEELAQQPIIALEELQPWAPALPLVLGAPAPVTDEELPQPPPPPGALEEYAAPAPLFALGPWTLPALVDEELAHAPPPALVDEEYAPPLMPPFAPTPPVLFAFDEEMAWQQVFEDYLPPLVFPAIVWAQSAPFYEEEFLRAPTTIAIEEYAPGQASALPVVGAPPYTVFLLDEEFVQFVPPIVGSVVVDAIGVGHYIGLGHV